MFDYTDFYIVDINDPNYNSETIIEDDIISVILQKYKMILFTNQGELFGDPNFGGNLETLLYETKVSQSYVKDQLYQQIGLYIPELVNMNYTLEVVFTQGSVNFYDIMWVEFKIADYEVYAQFGKSIN